MNTEVKLTDKPSRQSRPERGQGSGKRIDLPTKAFGVGTGLNLGLRFFGLLRGPLGHLLLLPHFITGSQQTGLLGGGCLALFCGRNTADHDVAKG